MTNFDTTKLQALRKEREQLNQHKIYSSDDSLRVVALKEPMSKKGSKGYRQGLTMVEDWKQNKSVQLSYDNKGQPIIRCYLLREAFPEFSTETQTSDFAQNDSTDSNNILSCEEYHKLPPEIKVRYCPSSVREINLPFGKAISAGNYFEIRITNLINKILVSRDRIVLDAFIELEQLNILPYKALTDSNPRNKMEALRNKKNRCTTANSYEVNIYFIGEIGLSVFQDLKPSASKAKELSFATTLYLRTGRQILGVLDNQSKAWGSGGVKSKFYNVSALEENRNNNIPSDTYKLEITFQNQKVVKPVTKYKTQPEILLLYKAEVLKELIRQCSHLSKQTMEMIKMELSATDKDVYEKMLSPDRTYFHIQKEIKRVDAKIEFEIRRLEKKVDNMDQKFEQRLSKAGL